MCSKSQGRYPIKRLGGAAAENEMSQSSPPCYHAVLDEAVDLPPHSESLVPVKIERLYSTDILEPSRDGFCDIAGLMAGHTLVDLEQPTVPVRVLNLF